MARDLFAEVVFAKAKPQPEQGKSRDLYAELGGAPGADEQATIDDLAVDNGFFDKTEDYLRRGFQGAGAGIDTLIAAGQEALGYDAAAAERRKMAAKYQRLSNMKIGGEVTWEDVKDKPYKAPAFIAQQGVSSAPLMVSMLNPVGIASVLGSQTGTIAQQRAENDGRVNADIGDVGSALPYAGLSTALERIGIKGIGAGIGKTAAARIGSAALAEGSTEFGQSMIEYAGSTFLTKKGLDPVEMLDQGFAGAVAGAGLGGSLRAVGETPGAVRSAVRARPVAPGARTVAAATSTVTDADVASPIPTDLIAAGKSVVADAMGTGTANTILDAAGMPRVGKRVTITMPDGRASTGLVQDAFNTDAGELGKANGIAIAMDDGSTLTEHFDTLADMGVTITPADLLAEADAIDAQLPDLAGQAPSAPMSTPAPAKAPRRGNGSLDASIVSGLRQRGLPEAVARGVAAGILAESANNHGAVNPTSGALGLGQWLGPRKAELTRRYGASPTLDQQLDFLVWELKGGDQGGKSVLSQSDEVGALNAYITDFMRPAKGAETNGDLSRGMAALGRPMTSGMEMQPGEPASVPAAKDEPYTSAAYTAGVDTSGDWVKFAPETGTLDVPRAEMPQIKAEHRGAMVNFLNARGIAHEEQTIPAASLKPTQAEFSLAKVEKAKNFEGGNRSILTSSDGYVLDGHHQWLAALDKGEDVKTIRLDAPIADLLKAVPEFPSATTESMTGEQVKSPVGTSLSADIVRQDDEGQSVEQSPVAAPEVAIEDRPGGKSVIVRGLSNSKADEARIRSALPEKALPVWNAKERGWVVSKKHAEKVRAALVATAASPNSGREFYLPESEGGAKPGLLPQGAILAERQRLANILTTDPKVNAAIEAERVRIQARESNADQTKDAPARRDRSAAIIIDPAAGTVKTVPLGKPTSTDRTAASIEMGQKLAEAMNAGPNSAAELTKAKLPDTDTSAFQASSPNLGADAAATAPAPVSSEEGEPETKPGYGQSNKLFTSDAAEKARALLRSKRNQLNSGFDPEIAQAGLTLMGYHIEAGARAFIDASRAVASDLGMTPADLRNNLRSWYVSARMWLEDNGGDVRGMDDDATVKVDLSRIDQWGAMLPPESAAPQAEEPTNAAATQSAGTEDNNLNRDAQRRAGDVSPVEDGGKTGTGSDRPGGRSDAGLSGDGRSGSGENRDAADTGGTDAGKPAREKRSSGSRAQPGDRVPDGPKPERRDHGVNFLAPVGSIKREGGWRATAERNLDIVELVNRIASENRPASPEEQAQLIKFTGWGAGDIKNNLFKDVSSLPGGGRKLSTSWQTSKEWVPLIERASKLLAGEDLETALQSVQYAHYTSEQVIRSIWAGIQRLGFNGGKILEPGMGTGLFAVAAPADVFGRSNYTGIELDGFTAKIAQLLLPQEVVLPGDYTKTKLPDGFFDIAIGNPPFARVKVTDDPAYKKHRFSLHDYFFAKTIDKVRPGGLLVFVTSRYTMDKLDQKARQYIADRADLLAAIRLPQTAFKENAGTEVVTDVLFLQRRAPGTEAGGQAWLTSEPLKIGANEANVNSYYLSHPEMVLGKHATTGSMYRANDYTVEPGSQDIEAAFAKAIEQLPSNVYAEASHASTIEAIGRKIEYDSRPSAEKEGAVYLKDGTLFRRENSIGTPVANIEDLKLSPKDVAWLADYVPLRDAIKQAQADQLKDGDWEKSLKALNKVYDAFVKKHGQISAFTSSERVSTDDEGVQTTATYKRFTNRKRLEVDIEGSLVEALEKIADDGLISKSPFLLGRTLKKPTRPEVASAADAVAVTLDEIGRFDLPYVAKLLGKPHEQVIEELGDEIFQHPDGSWLMADEYLSGDVVSKLDEASIAAKADPRFERNVGALVKAQPRPLSHADIAVKLGAGWIEASTVEQFAREVLDEDLTGIRYEPATGTWHVPDSSRRLGRTSVSDWATDDRSARELLDAILNNRTIKVTRTDKSDSKTTTWTDQEATALANERAKKIGERFKTWIWTDGPRSTRLVEKYNRLFNNLAPRKFDGKHLTFPGLSTRYKLFDHQRRAIWRVIATGNTYLNHAVGAGKTLEMIVSGMEQRRLGLIRKPMYVVPNHMLNQFAREFLDAYPAANIMVADEASFHTGNRRRFMAQAALNDPDAIIITHSSFGKIQTSQETRQKVVGRFIDELSDVMNELKGSDNRIARSKIEKQIEQVKRRFEGKASVETKDKALTFEEMGVDFLFLDEAHEFRKLDFATNRTNVKGITAQGSQRSLDLYTKLLWLNDQRPGRAAVLASGTPVTNTMAEIFTVMRYMDQAGLERDGLAAFDAWAAMFGEVVAGFEQNPSGSYEMVERFSKFVNVPEMMKRVRTFMDVLTSEQLGDIVVRPTLKGGLPENVIAEASDRLNAYMKGALAERIERARRWKPTKEQPGNPDPIINIITDGRLSAIDMRFVNPNAENDPKSKLNLMIDKIIAKHKEFGDVEYVDKATGKPLPRKGATQIIFSAVGFGDQVAASRGFNARAWIDKRLAEAGVSKDAVAWMGDQNSNAKKEAVFKAMRGAEKRMLFGSPKNMGTGVNVQSRLKVLHYLSPPWYPSDVEQPHGRIIRQGNMNPEAEIYWYATKGTYDSTAWNMVSRKQRFIEQAMRGDDSIRSLEDISEANQYEMASALAAGDERVIQMAGLSNDIERLTKLKAAHGEEQANLKWRMEALERHISQKGAAAIRYAAAIEARGDIAQPFSVSVDGARYEKPGEAGEAMLAQAQIALDGYTLGHSDIEVELGRYLGGLPVIIQIGSMQVDQKPTKVFDVIVRTGPVDLPILDTRTTTASIDAPGLSQRIANAVRKLDADKVVAEREIAEAQREQAQATRKIGARFEYDAELGEKVAERAQMQAEMAAETEAAQKAADAKASAEAPTQADDVSPPFGVIAKARDGAYDGANGYQESSERTDPLRGLGNPGTVSVRGLAIATEIKQAGRAALVGHAVGTPEELAALAQVYRDPRYETFRVFFTKGNQIVHATGVTSRLAGDAPLLPGNNADTEFNNWLKQQIDASGADGYYLLHNHPSGDPKPSQQDIAVTKQIAAAVPGYKGHVVINSKRFAVIGKDGGVGTHGLGLGIDKLLTPSVPHPVLGHMVNGTEELARMAKGLQQPGYLTIIATDPKLKVRAVIDFPRAHLEKSDLRLLAAVRKVARVTGSSDIMLVGTRDDMQHPSVIKGFEKGYILDGTDGSYNLVSHHVRHTAKDVRLPFGDVTTGKFVSEGRGEFTATPASFDNAETEKRFQEAKGGLDTPVTFRERVSETFEKAFSGLTRHWISLPNVPKYAHLQEKLRAIEAAPQAAKERTVAMLEDMVDGFSKDDLDLFTRKVILDDLSWDMANDRELPFGFTPETLASEKAKIDAIVQAQPNKKVWKAAMKRKLANRKIAEELVDVGVLEAAQIRNPAYYRHQVLEYARAQMKASTSMRGTGKRLRTPKWAKRMGSSLDINANLLEAEFDWLSKAFMDIPVAKTLNWIKESEHNIIDQLRKQAKDSNAAGIASAIEEAHKALEDARSGDDEKAQAMSLIDTEKGFRQSIAMGFDIVRQVVRDGEIEVPARFESAASAIVEGKGAVGDPPFAFLSWMLDNNEPGAMGAAMIMKAIGQRRAWTKKLLGKAYVDPQDAQDLLKSLAPEGYATWQPDEGKLLFTVKTIPEHVIDGMIERLDAPEGIDPSAFRATLEQARSALAMGSDRYTMIIPQEVADTLNQLRRDDMDGLFEHLVQEPVRLWKRWVLVNPRRFFKYNINNLSGDLDVVLAGNPRLLRHIGKAGRELRDVMLGKAKASPRYEEAVARGVFDSGLSVQEIPDINRLSPFERFADSPATLSKVAMLPLRKAWAGLQGFTQWRENVFRYAAYLDYVQRLEGGESQSSIGYGASRRSMVEAVPDMKDRAALLARDLLGDYGAISHYGGTLRQTVIPFWSWMEINTKRYWRLTSNAYSEGIGKGLAVGGALGAVKGARVTAYMALRAAVLYGVIALWNGLLFSDEEDDLTEEQRRQLHVILGRNEAGEVVTLRTQGALSDALSWFGWQDVMAAAKEYDLGRKSLADVIGEGLKAPINKLATSVSPLISVPVESATGKKIWPDVFNTRANRDPWRNLFSTISLENEYDWFAGLPSRGYGRSWQEAFVYRRDPGELAYNAARGMAYDWLEREKGQSFEGGISTKRGNAMREYKTALKFGDEEAAQRALDKMIALGVDDKALNRSIQEAHPLGPIAKKDYDEFLGQLTKEELDTFQRAEVWYQQTFF